MHSPGILQGDELEPHTTMITTKQQHHHHHKTTTTLRYVLLLCLLGGWVGEKRNALATATTQGETISGFRLRRRRRRLGILMPETGHDDETTSTPSRPDNEVVPTRPDEFSLAEARLPPLTMALRGLDGSPLGEEAYDALQSAMNDYLSKRLDGFFVPLEFTSVRTEVVSDRPAESGGGNAVGLGVGLTFLQLPTARGGDEPMAASLPSPTDLEFAAAYAWNDLSKFRNHLAVEATVANLYDFENLVGIDLLGQFPSAEAVREDVLREDQQRQHENHQQQQQQQPPPPPFASIPTEASEHAITVSLTPAPIVEETTALAEAAHVPKDDFKSASVEDETFDEPPSTIKEGGIRETGPMGTVDRQRERPLIASAAASTEHGQHQNQHQHQQKPSSEDASNGIPASGDIQDATTSAKDNADASVVAKETAVTIEDAVVSSTAGEKALSIDELTTSQGCPASFPGSGSSCAGLIPEPFVYHRCGYPEHVCHCRDDSTFYACHPRPAPLGEDASGATGAADDTTSAIESTSPTIEDSASTIEDSTSTIKDSTTEDSTSTIQNASGAADDTTSAIENTSTSTIEDSTSTIEDSTSTIEDSTSTIKDSTSTAGDTDASAATDTTAATDDVTTTIEDAPSTTEDATSSTGNSDASGATEDATPAVENPESASSAARDSVRDVPSDEAIREDWTDANWGGEPKVSAATSQLQNEDEKRQLNPLWPALIAVIAVSLCAFMALTRHYYQAKKYWKEAAIYYI